MRKTVAPPEVRAAAIRKKKLNPQMTAAEIARALGGGVTERQVRYWLKGEAKGDK